MASAPGAAVEPVRAAALYAGQHGPEPFEFPVDLNASVQDEQCRSDFLTETSDRSTKRSLFFTNSWRGRWRAKLARIAR